MTEADGELESGRGREARWPSQIPSRGWIDILWRVAGQVSQDRVTLIAAGAAFYVLLALFPTLAAFVSLYGLIADPNTITEQISYLGGILPEGGMELIQSQLETLASQSSDALSIGFIIALLTALWSANNGTKTMFEALNVAYNEREKRGFIVLNLVAFVFTLGGMVVSMAVIAAVGIVPTVLSFLNLDQFAELIIRIGRWVLTLIIVAVAVSLLYRFGPSRRNAKWRWITWGGTLVTVVWLVASVGFSFYLQNFADYNATYGSLGAAIGFMLWIWISLLIVLVGAEINAEMEHQTAKDSTIGEDRPMGERGAMVADTLGDSRSEKE